MANDVDIRIDGDSDGAEDAVQATTRSLERLFSATREVEGGFRRVDRSSSRAASELGKTSASAKATTNNLEAMKRGAQAAGGRVGEMAGRVEALGQGLGLLGGPGGAALLAAASVAAVAIAAAATAAAMVKLTRAGRDAVEALEPLRGSEFGLTDQQIASIEGANKALDGVVLAGQRLVAAIAAEIGPEVTTLANGMIGLTLAATRATAAVVEAARRGIEFADKLGPALLLLAPPLFLLKQLTQGLVEASDIDAVDGFWDAYNAGARSGAAAASEAAEEAYDMAAALRQLEDIQERAGSDLLRSEADITRELDRRLETLREIQAQMIANGATAAEIAELRAAYDAVHSRAQREILAIEEEVRAARLDGLQRQIALGGEIAGRLSDMFAESARKRADEDEKAAKRSRIAAIALFAVQQATAAANVIVDTARNSVALAAPPPIGLGPIAGPIFAATQGAAAGLAIAATPPPKFHIGGVVNGGPVPPGGRPTERMAIVEDGERILTREQQRQQGGPVTVIAQLSMGRRFAEEVVLTSKRTGGAMARVSEPRGRGQRRYRR